MTAALCLDSVHKAYAGVGAVNGISLAVEPGEVLTIIGPSGCGKSTVLRLIAGLIAPDIGTVEVGGHVVAGKGAWQPAETRRVGMVFQDHALFPHLSVAHNIGFGLNTRTKSDRKRRTAEVLDLVGLHGYAARRPHELSGGEQQRVALARALAPGPDVVLLDEPFSSLDENLRTQVRNDTLSILRDAGTAAVLVTHDQVEALSLGDRLAILRNGMIEQLGSPVEVYSQPANRFVAQFMGEADFLAADVVADVVRCELGEVPNTRLGAGDSHNLQVMLRPHEVTMVGDPAGNGVVTRIEYHGAYTLHAIRLLGSGNQVLVSRLGTPLPIGATVAVAVAPGAHPVLLPGDEPASAAHE